MFLCEYLLWYRVLRTGNVSQGFTSKCRWNRLMFRRLALTIDPIHCNLRLLRYDYDDGMVL